MQRILSFCLVVAFVPWSSVCAQAPGAPQAPAPPQPGPINFQEVLERAKEKVFPALVFVKPIIEDYEAGEKQKHEVFGSGVIISADGLVVTNNHVVDKAIKVDCVLFDKDQVRAQIVGKDLDTDLALLKLEVPAEKLPLPFGEFADSKNLTEGDFVMALGSPFGFTRSISLGIVSNTQRYLGFETEYKYNTWLQTDAAINPGNSGGPLVNTEGKIVGINTLAMFFFAENVGFAIPANVAQAIAQRLQKDGKVQRAWSGIKLQPLKDFYTNTFTKADAGVLVGDVEPRSPAAVAGIMKGDILLTIGDKALNGTYVEDLPGLAWAIADMPADTPLPVAVLRGGQTVQCTMTLSLKGKVEGDTFDCRRWNMTVKEINKFKDPEVYFYQKEGVFVEGVRYPGNAMKAGVGRGDILTSIDRKPVTNLESVKTIYEQIMADEKREKRTLIEVIRDGYKKWITLDYTVDYEKEN